MSIVDIQQAFSDMVTNRYYGKFAGVVVDVDDPKKIGRLRAKVPEILGEDTQSGWAMPCMPAGGGADHGFYAMPQAGDTVWIEFAAGDLTRPIWAGCFWGAPTSSGGQNDLGTASGAEAPKGFEADAAPGQNIWKTASGHLISLDDEGGVVVISEASGAEVKITASGEITLTADKIMLGSNAGEKLVLGDAFKALFNSHTHPTGVGPSGPPVQPMTGQHLSTVSKTE